MLKVVSTVTGKVVVRRDAPKAVSDGGLVLPERAREKSAFATVVALPVRYDGPLFVGARVLLEWFAGTEVGLGERLFVCQEADVLALLDEEGGAA